jgi:hypothetical protein
MNNPWITHRILEFLNRAQKPRDIVRFVQDDPSDGPGKAIGPVLAKRIIDHRNSLTFGRFTTQKEVFAVKGFGPDKWDDLEFSLGVPAIDAFEKSLFEKQYLLENWTLLHYDWKANSQEEFQQTVQDDKAFRHTVRALAERAAAETAGHNADTTAALTEPLLHLYIDSYHNSSQQAALAFALWFYLFSADNWFSFDEMLAETNTLFTYHAVPLWDMELRLFKGFDNRVFTNLICPPDLPVLVNYPEETISIWVSGLAD